MSRIQAIVLDVDKASSEIIYFFKTQTAATQNNAAAKRETANGNGAKGQ